MLSLPTSKIDPGNTMQEELMDSPEFAKMAQARVAVFCRELDDNLSTRNCLNVLGFRDITASKPLQTGLWRKLRR